MSDELFSLSLVLAASLGPMAIGFRWLEKRFGPPSAPRRLRDTVLDLGCWFFVPLATAAATQLIAIDRIFSVGPLRGAIGAQPLWLQALEALVLSDLIGYGTHRAFHGRMLFGWHRLHHSSKQVDWLSAARLHPLNDLLSSWARLAALSLVGFDVGRFTLVLPLVGLHLVLIHANVPFRYGPLAGLLVSPAYHRRHHAPGPPKNFASIFPLIDALFGTQDLPKAAHRHPRRQTTPLPIT